MTSFLVSIHRRLNQLFILSKSELVSPVDPSFFRGELLVSLVVYAFFIGTVKFCHKEKKEKEVSLDHLPGSFHHSSSREERSVTDGKSLIPSLTKTVRG